MARERGMSAPVDLHMRGQEYLAERRRLGFQARSLGHALANLACFPSSFFARLRWSRGEFAVRAVGPVARPPLALDQAI